MTSRIEKHKAAVNHIQRIIGQLRGLENTINNDSSCIDISTEMYSIMQSMKGLSKKMFINSLQNSIMKRNLSETEQKKIDKLMRLLT